MRYVFLFLCAVCVVIWLIGWVLVIAEQIEQKYNLKFSKWLSEMTEKSSKWLCLFLTAIICSGCSTRTCAPIEYPSCPPMLREATYKAMQADERRDYRIAIEKCKTGKNARPVN